MFNKTLLFFVIIGLFACKSGENSSSDGMTASGYKYSFHTDVDGPVAQVGDQIIFDIDMLDDKGEVIQNMRNAPTKPSAQITAEGIGGPANPVMDCLRLMGAGDSLSIFIPADSLKAPAPGFEESSYLQYVIAAKEVMSAEDFKARVDADNKIAEEKMELIKSQEKEKLQEYGLFLNDHKAGKFDGKSIALGDGLSLYIIEEGTGEKIKSGQLAEIHYFGYLMGGRCFDNSYKYGRPYGVNVGSNSVIQGWERALLEMKEGTKALVVIPPELAYGEKGSGVIPANSTLAFYMDVTDVYY